jgi:hypothetical protein
MMHRSQNPLGSAAKEYFNEKRPVNLRRGVVPQGWFFRVTDVVEVVQSPEVAANAHT